MEIILVCEKKERYVETLHNKLSFVNINVLSINKQYIMQYIVNVS